MGIPLEMEPSMDTIMAMMTNAVTDLEQAMKRMGLMTKVSMRLSSSSHGSRHYGESIGDSLSSLSNVNYGNPSC